MIKINIFLLISLMILPLRAEKSTLLGDDVFGTKIIQWEKGYEVAKKKIRKKKRTSRSKKVKRARSRKKGKKYSRLFRVHLGKAVRFAKAENYSSASKIFFRLSRNPRYRSERIQLKYLLGLMFYEMGLRQTAAFQFVEVVKAGESKYLKQSLEKLSLAAGALGDSTLLNYAISKVRVRNFPKEHRDMLNFRIGEYKENAKNHSDAAKYFSKVSSRSPLYFKAKYNQALSYAEQGKINQAIKVFNYMGNTRVNKGGNDPIRTLALLSKARLYYQGKKWNKAIEAYREVPRDTPEWHKAMFESSWAMLRTARFRSALSNFHTLHSPYYTDVYQPESFLLRAIIYLYICKYDEMKKVLVQFDEIYGPIRKSIARFFNNNKISSSYLDELKRAYKTHKYQKLKKNGLPYILGKKLLQEPDIQKSLDYLNKIEGEGEKIKSMTASWGKSSVGVYAKKILSLRIENAKKKLGKKVRAYLIRYKVELRDFEEQAGFIRYEMINGRKDSLKKRIAGKGIGISIEKDKKRDFYVQNGYEFWPFQGEYWLDEIGNYHYVGTQSCE